MVALAESRPRSYIRRYLFHKCPAFYIFTPSGDATLALYHDSSRIPQHEYCPLTNGIGISASRGTSGAFRQV
jgi:hypothetical protein